MLCEYVFFLVGGGLLCSLVVIVEGYGVVVALLLGDIGVVGVLCDSGLVCFLRTRGNSWVENVNVGSWVYVLVVCWFVLKLLLLLSGLSGWLLVGSVAVS